MRSLRAPWAPLLVALSALWATSVASHAQIPQTFTNLRYFSRNMERPVLLEQMRQFSFALGVRCQHCHAGGDGVSFQGVDFASDAKPAKTKAREMLRMVDEINSRLLPALTTRAAPAVSVSCVTCHRGLPVPRTLEDVLYDVVVRDGPAAASTQYAELRKSAHLGRYNFGEWSLNQLAGRLEREGLLPQAVAILKLNQEHYPASADIDVLMGDLLVRMGNTSGAIAAFKSALQKSPSNSRARAQLAALGVK